MSHEHHGPAGLQVRTRTVRSNETNTIRSPPITRLPIELLTSIFAMLSNDRVSGTYHGGYYRDYFRPETRMHWVRFMLVCRHWYNVGQSSPWLWRRISITGNMESLKYRLSRTVGCTIDVFFSDDGEANNSAMTLLIPFAPHIRTLETSSDFSFAILPSIRPLFQVQLPALEDIKLLPSCRLAGALKDRGDWFDFKLGLSGELHPHIRRLEINAGMITIPPPPAFFSTLRGLVIDFKYLQNSPLCPQEFVKILAHSPRLEVLEVSGLSDHVWSYPPNPASLENEVDPQTPTRCRLSCLRTIILKCSYHFATLILQAVDAPDLAVFHVELESRKSPIAVSEIGSLIFPPSLQYLVQQYTEVIVASTGRWRFQIYDTKSQLDRDAYDRNRLHLEVKDYTGTLNPLEAALTTLSGAFGIAPQMRSLCFARFGLPPASPTLWNPIPAIFPDLRSVTLRNCSPPVVAHFLLEFQELSKSGAWPAVCELDISTGANWMPTSRGVHVVACLLLAAVRARAQRGVPLASVRLEHDLLVSTPLIPHRWTLWAIRMACGHFDFSIYHGRNHIPKRLGQLFTGAEWRRLLDGSWDVSGASDSASDSDATTPTANVDSLEDDESGHDEDDVTSLQTMVLEELREVVAVSG